MYPHIFCPQHIMYILIYIMFMLISLYIFSHYINPKYYVILIKFFAILNLSLTFWNRLSVCNYELFTLKILPPSFCSTTGFLGSLALLFLNRNSKILHFLLFAGGLSGFSVTLFPDYIAQNISFFYDKTFSSLLYHTGMFYLLVLTIKLKYFIPLRKNWFAVPIGFIPYFIWGYIGNTYLGHANNMYLKESPIKDVNMPWYFVAIIFILIYTIVLFLLDKPNKNEQLPVSK